MQFGGMCMSVCVRIIAYTQIFAHTHAHKLKRNIKLYILGGKQFVVSGILVNASRVCLKFCGEKIASKPTTKSFWKIK